MDTQIFAYTLSGEPVEIGEPVELGFSFGKFFKRAFKKTTKFIGRAVKNTGKFVNRVVKKSWVPVRKAVARTADRISTSYFGVPVSALFSKPKHTRNINLETPYSRTAPYTSPVKYTPAQANYKAYDRNITSTSASNTTTTTNMLPLLIGAGLAFYMWRKK
ncbi:hypothetical protein [Desulfurobacterium atlanticum]|uniref:Uncharacterized protein n=1 Tax=Desulfurobacterium atlanticum TaxID=240169 RepID=A0A238ZK54_9BACT|nr:hypothetical protein [Desulfurobacterium atlanticum]SNR83499.1 hypothetical protein SAMN06265340_10928 [Desulfurobacterium atlanticum]